MAAQVVTLDPMPGYGSRACPSRSPGSIKPDEINAWFVRSIMLATTVFAIVDLSLLISSVHH